MIKMVDITDVEDALAAKVFHVIDVREADEFAQGHLSGALNLPLSSLEQSYHKLDKEQPYHVICQLGGRSAQACVFLDAKGYDVTNIAGGMAAWLGDIEK